MSIVSREAIESPVSQGVDERIAYALTIPASWGGTGALSNIAAVVKDVTDGFIDVTTTLMPVNSPSASGRIITLSRLGPVVAGHQYRVEVKFDSGGNTFEAFLRVFGEV